LKVNNYLLKIAKKICKWFPFIEPYIYKYARKKAKRSKGEIMVVDWLTNNNIKFEQEYLIKFPFIVRKKPFIFIDFYLPEHNMFIEYNGKQHYEYVPYFHKNENDFERQKFRDFIVRDYCEKKGIKLLEIPYYLKKDEVYELLKTTILND
jgi:very-short-patch-repair endonuclease